MKVYYHANCVDGVAGAAVVNYKYPEKQIQFIPNFYETPADFSKIVPDETIYIIDTKFQIDEMLDLLEITSNVIFIDHHETTIQEYKDKFPRKLSGILDTASCGALLTWKYIFPYTDIPPVLILLDDYDRWIHEHYPKSLYFNKGVQAATQLDPLSQVWKQLFKLYETEKENNLLKQIVQQGKAIQNYQNVLDESKPFYEIDWEGLHMIVTNGIGNSQTFDSVDDGSYDALGTWWYEGEYYAYRLYSSKKFTTDSSAVPHLGRLASKYGGGGHHGAAGFSAKKLFWKRGKQENGNL